MAKKKKKDKDKRKGTLRPVQRARIRCSYYAYKSEDDNNMNIIVKFRDVPDVAASGVTLKEAMFRAADNLKDHLTKLMAEDIDFPGATVCRDGELVVSILV